MKPPEMDTTECRETDNPEMLLLGFVVRLKLDGNHEGKVVL